MGKKNILSINQPYQCVQELPEADAAAERYPYPAEELCRLPQAEELAVVEALHQGQSAPPGKPSSLKILVMKNVFILIVKFPFWFLPVN